MDTSVGNIKRLTINHISLYSSRLNWAKKSPDQKVVNVSITKRLLEIWLSIKSKGYDWNSLNDRERDEVFDAIYSGE